MAEFLSEVFESVNGQLSESYLRPDNFYAQAKFAKSLISKALATDDVNAARSAAAMYGGVIKRWRRWLIESLTFVALADVETSRTSVRDWQTQMFGQSVASSLLRQYGKVERSEPPRESWRLVGLS